MLSVREARDRAVQRAIRTGELSNIDVIHQTQVADGNEPCFARLEVPCRRTQCKWFDACNALLAGAGKEIPAAR